MISQIGNHLWQSTVFAAAAWLLTLALRQNGARLRHAVWLAAGLKFLVPFAALLSMGQHVEWRTAEVYTPPSFAAIVDQVSEPFPHASAVPAPISSAPAQRANPWPSRVLAVWAFGVVGIAVSWLIRWRRLQAVVRDAREIEIDLPIRTLTSDAHVEPGIFGIFRPVLMLPEGIFERLSPPQLQSVIEHELCHVRHRDNLFAAMHMAIETMFWFHPLVWWIGKRMIAERERACDEAVLGSGNEPRTYAEAILNVCKLYVESPLPCVAGVTGAELKGRIQTILSGRVATELSAAKKVALGAAAIAALLGPIAIGMLHAPVVRAQTLGDRKDVPKWEVASIKPCSNGESGGRKSGGGAGPLPERFRVNCSTVMRLVEGAYATYANGRGLSWNHVAFEGAPAWLNSERYSIEAKPESPQGITMMRGPMMQTLLEERLKLKIRREVREVPVYHLTLAKGGPRNLKPTQPGSCVALDLDHLAIPEPGKPDPVFCGMFGRKRIAEGERGFKDPGVTMAAFAEGISAMLDRNVIDETGLAGTFDIDVQVSLPDPPPRDDSNRQAQAEDESDLVFAVVQKLGMKLEAAKGPGVAYVIEHVERPSNDFDPKR